MKKNESCTERQGLLRTRIWELEETSLSLTFHNVSSIIRPVFFFFEGPNKNEKHLLSFF